MAKDEITILAIGDIVGRPGRRCLEELLGSIKSTWKPDIIVGNGENVAGGFGITEKIFKQLTDDLQLDVITTGNHWADKKEVLQFGPKYSNLLLPGNMYNVKDLRRGYCIRTTKSGHQFAVINLTGRVYMKGENLCPFISADRILANIPDSVKIKIVDLHAEVTSEKQALAHYLCGRISLCYGTHTHCPTGDERILNGKTGFTTDIGMTGAYDSVIGMRKELSINYFLTGERTKFEPAQRDPWLCAIVAKIDPQTGYCHFIERIRLKISSPM